MLGARIRRSFAWLNIISRGSRTAFAHTVLLRVCVWGVAVLLATLVSVADRASAEPELALSWTADASCPDIAWARERLRERLGREPAELAHSALRVSAEFRHADAQFVLLLHSEQGDSQGDRRVAGKECRELAEAAVLMLALALDSEAAARSDGTPRMAATDDELPPGLRPKEQAKPVREALLDHFWVVRASGIASLGDQPKWSGGGQIAAGYEWPGLRAELDGFWLAPRTGGHGADGRVRVSLWVVRPTVCASFVGQRTQVQGCAGFELGEMSGQGLGLNRSQRNHLLWSAAALGPRVSWAITRHLGLIAELWVTAVLDRPRFISTNAQGGQKTSLAEAGVVSGRAALGLEARF
jgi:hypothetical protein